MNRKISSVFWCIIYAMPLVILLISYVGYFNLYKENQDYNIESNTNIVVGKELYDSTIVPNDEYVEKLYFNTSFSADKVVDILSNANITWDIYSDGDPNEYRILITENMSIMIWYANDIYFVLNEKTQHIYFLSSDIGYGFVGWNPSFFTDKDYLEVNSNALSFYNGENNGFDNSELSSLFSITPIQYIKLEDKSDYNDTLLIPNKINKDGVESTEYLSLFDITLIHTIDTFNGFVWQPIGNGFKNLFDVINFTTNGYISKFIILFITWFTQSIFMHLFVDIMLFLPNMCKKFFERWA